MTDIVERLRSACDGHPHAKIEWPHRILHEAADCIEELTKALQRARISLNAVAVTTGSVSYHADVSAIDEVLEGSPISLEQSGSGK